MQRLVMPPVRHDSALHAAAFGVLGLGGGWIVALILGVEHEAFAWQLLSFTALSTALVGLAASRLDQLLPGVIWVCIGGGALNGALLGGASGDVRAVPLGAIFGAFVSLPFVVPVICLGMAIRRLRDARVGSLLHAAYLRSIGVCLVGCIGIARALVLHGQLNALTRSIALAVLVLFAIVEGLLLRQLGRVRALAARRAGLVETATPVGMQVPDYVDLGTGAQSYEALVSDAGLRGAPDVRTVFAGDALATREALRALAFLDGGLLLLTACSFLA